jgi:hypothetical protein
VRIDGCNAAKNNKIAMEHLQAADLLRFAEKEAEMLQQMQVKISNELHRLQVEEELFVRTMERLKENSKKSSKMQDGEEEARRNCEDAEGNKAGLELLEALQVELAQFSGENPLAVDPLQSIAPTS